MIQLINTPISKMLATGGLLCIGTIWGFLGSAAAAIGSIFSGTKTSPEAKYEEMYKQSQQTIISQRNQIAELKEKAAIPWGLIIVVIGFLGAAFFLLRKK